MEFLVKLALDLPPDMDERARDDLLRREREHGIALREAGRIVRIWRVPGMVGNVSVWSAADASDMHALLAGLPIFPWCHIDVTALADHPLEG